MKSCVETSGTSWNFISKTSAAKDGLKKLSYSLTPVLDVQCQAGTIVDMSRAA
jgi:hypothetical protein